MIIYNTTGVENISVVTIKDMPQATTPQADAIALERTTANRTFGILPSFFDARCHGHLADLGRTCLNPSDDQSHAIAPPVGLVMLSEGGHFMATNPDHDSGRKRLAQGRSGDGSGQ